MKKKPKGAGIAVWDTNVPIYQITSQDPFKALRISMQKWKQDH